MKTYVWDPGVDDISRVSAQEDTSTHTGYNAIHMEVAVCDGVQWHTGGLGIIEDSGWFSALSLDECVDGDSTIDISSEIHEVSPQQDYDRESRHLTCELRFSEDMIMAAIKHIDDTHTLVVGYCWRDSMAHDSPYGGISIDDLYKLRERVTMMRANYQKLLMDKDYLLEVGDMYHRVLAEKESEVDKLTHELVRTWGFLEGT
jgi:hypothetical protein